MYDLIIVGGGPAGLTAAVYALNKRLGLLAVSENLGGKTLYGFQAQGYEGHEVIRGIELIGKFKRQLEYLNFAHQRDRVTKIMPEDGHYVVHVQTNQRFEAKAILIATGAQPKRLDVPGEKKLMGKGLSYSAISHAQLFIDREPAIVGSNRRALEAAAELALIAKQVHLVLPEKSESESAFGKKLRSNPKVKVYNAPVKEVRGDQFVESIVIGNKEIIVDGLFIEIGLTPGTECVEGLGITNADGRIKVDVNCASSRLGLFAAGDVTNVHIEQVLVAIGEGAKAALSAYEYLIHQ